MTMMKKIFVSAALLFAGITASFAGDRERPITLDKLPAAAQEFLAANFKDLTLAYAVEDPKFIGSEYEVIYTDRTEVVPVQIADYVKKSFAGESIRKIDRDKYTWEVELSNGLEIKFDRNFQVIDIDD